jgi:hypothetical protein
MVGTDFISLLNLYAKKTKPPRSIRVRSVYRVRRRA